MKERPAALWPGLGVAALVVIVDQATKWWILTVVMQPPRAIAITPFFNIVLGWNRGISFGLFNSDNGMNVWLLSLLALFIVVALVVWLRRARGLWLASALGLVIGGALGNVVDRARYGAVTDFLDLHFGGYHWPAFNVADSAITLGAVLLIAESLFFGEKKLKKAGKRRADDRK